MRKILHDRLSCGSIDVIDAGDWSYKKSTTDPKRSNVNTDTFTTIEKTYLTRSFLEIEKDFFDNIEEEIFAESSEDCNMSLSNRCNTLLLMDERNCFSRSFFHSVNY